MKKIFMMAFAATTFSMAGAQSLNTPQASPTQTIKQNFATGNIELSYSRPAKKDRVIFGDLVPFGKVWRTGANSATTLNFSEDVTIGGKEVKAGKYGLLSIPNADKWTLILTKDLNVTSPAAYKQENDVVRVDADVMALPFSVENFTINFGDITSSSTNLHLYWDKTFVMLPITTNTDARVMKQIDDAINKDNKPYFSAAQYYYDNGKDLKKALEWVGKGIEGNKTAFWMYMLKARILNKLGDNAAAKTAANMVIELATKAKNDDYIKMGNDFIKGL